MVDDEVRAVFAGDASAEPETQRQAEFDEVRPSARVRDRTRVDWLDERPDGSVAPDGDDLPPVRSDGGPVGRVVVHHDHRVVINYNASSQAARHRALTRPSGERERVGGF